MNQDRLDITDLDKSEVLAALCNNTQPVGLGKLNLKAFDVITADVCLEAFNCFDEDSSRMSFDYFCGRPIKVSFCIEGDRVLLDYWWLYDRDSIMPAAEIIKELRKESNDKTKS